MEDRIEIFFWRTCKIIIKEDKESNPQYKPPPPTESKIHISFAEKLHCVEIKKPAKTCF